MIKRMYINNYRCLVNFEWRPGPLSLLMGPNGAGKSTVLSCLERLRTFVVGGGNTDVLFIEDELTRWAGDKIQSFEIEVEGNGGTYLYRLRVEVDRGHGRSFMREESLLMNGKPLFELKTGDDRLCGAQLYRDNFSKGPEVLSDWSRSGVGSLQSRPDNSKLIWFRQFIARLLVVKINPFSMEVESEFEAERPSFAMANFVSWYRYLSQEHQGKILELFGMLREVLGGFHSLTLPKTGEKRKALRALFRGKDSKDDIPFGWDELSDGQRVLIALYTIVELCVSTGSTVCIDEPDNYVATREIQPWLLRLQDKCIDGSGQAILISHHPEIVDYLGSTSGYWMQRESNAPARIRKLSAQNGKIKLSELIARGWVGE